MVFVHSRKDTFKTAEKLFELSQSENQMGTPFLFNLFSSSLDLILFVCRSLRSR
jgi:hypothetical protein